MSRHSGRAVSPVIAVILMVAITVILSAVIGTFVLNLGQGLDGDQTQSIGVRTAIDGQNVTYQVITGEADEVRLLVNGSIVDSISNVSPGDALTGNISNTSTVAVVAVNAGESTVVSTKNPLQDSGGASTASGPTAPTDGLIAHYPFDTDSYSGATYLPDGGPQQDGAYSFDGSSEYISGLQTVPSGSHTIAAWVNVDNFTTHNKHIFGDPDSGNYGAYLEAHTTEGLIYSLGDSANWKFTSSGRKPTGKWVHVVGTYNGSTATLYINGSQVAQNTYGYSDSTQNSWIGREPHGNWDNDLAGRVDDGRIYDRALNSSEVSDLYNATK